MRTLPKQIILAGALLGTLALNGCDQKPAPSTEAKPAAAAVGLADTIYTGGHIITINDAAPSAEALAVKDGKILAVGAKADVLKTKGAATKLVELGGKTLLPGFIDGHSHFISALTAANQANVYPAPFGPGSSIEGIIGALKKLQQDQHIKPGEIIQAYGYDENALPADHQLSAADLDPHFPENPVLVGHVSMHGAVLNSAAMKKYNFTVATATPPGGIILRKPGTSEPAGLVMEMAYLPIHSNLPKPSPDQTMAALKKAQLIYAAAGITTAQEGSTTAADIKILQRGAAEGNLFIDVVAYPFVPFFEEVLKDNPPATFGKYNHRLKLGGIKLTLDGSPQGKTAWFTAPYLTGGPAGEKNWKGEPSFPVPILQGQIKKVYDAGLDLIIHCNGDAAVDLFLATHEAVLGDQKAGDHRTGIIHCQFVRRDQLDKIAAWKIIPSFYTEHTYFFATTHIANRGPEQGSFISPTKSALDRGIRFANHTDYYVAPIDQLFVVWSAVNRVSREGGVVVGPAERISPMEALKALTIHPAYWYREEATKGSLEVGKLADLVILDKNPLNVDPMTIKDIKVVETIKEGRSVYRAPGQ